MFKGSPRVASGEFSRRVAREGGRDNAFHQPRCHGLSPDGGGLAPAADRDDGGGPLRRPRPAAGGIRIRTPRGAGGAPPDGGQQPPRPFPRGLRRRGVRAAALDGPPPDRLGGGDPRHHARGYGGLPPHPLRPGRGGAGDRGRCLPRRGRGRAGRHLRRHPGAQRPPRLRAPLPPAPRTCALPAARSRPARGRLPAHLGGAQPRVRRGAPRPAAAGGGAGAGRGQGSRLHRALVETGLAVSATASAWVDTVGAGMFAIAIAPRAGASLAAVEQAATAEVARLLEEGSAKRRPPAPRGI